MNARISLCMIVRDEIDSLEACLDSVAPWVDEIVVVDTGSVDGTWELVQIRAHRCRQIEWPDHFGEARNASLDLATGEWVLILDADERLADGGPALRAAVANPDLLAAEVRIDNDLGGGEIGAFWAPRLFRRLPDIRFEGRIHEQVAPGLRRRCERERRWTTGRIEVVLSHDGYVPAVFEKRGKAERNVRMLEMSLHELSADATLHERVYLKYKLSTALGAGPAGQVYLYRAARMLLDATAEACTTVPLAPEILVSAGQAWCRGGQPEAALEAINRGDALSPGHAMLDLVRGQALLAQGDLDRAEAALLASRESEAEGFYFDRRALDVASTIGLVELAFRREHQEDAIRLLGALRARHPGHSQAEIAWVHGLIRAGMAQDAMRAAVAYLRSQPGDRQGLLACASAAEALGMNDRAQEWRAKALG
jgi:tetratricopeptide (TPR) repeat protein